ncbi:MAG: hypothetical protein ABUL72_01605, partial [Armatimonadota bacterium]
TKDENVAVQNSDATKGDLKLSYGLYRARVLQPEALVSDPNSAVLVAETSNHGSNSSYNPTPMITSNDKEVEADGFIIGWDNSNFGFTFESSAVTRLAFSHVADGKFGGKDADTRHDKHINALLVGGNLHHLSPQDAFVERTGNRLTGLWEAR